MSGNFVAGVGVVAAGLAVIGALLFPPSRLRSALMLAGLALAGVLILGDGWNQTPISEIRASAPKSGALLIAAGAAIVAVAAVVRRWSVALPLLVIAALPFRVPLNGGGDQANLLLPLYVVIAGGAVAVALRQAGPAGSLGDAFRASTWLRRALCAFALVYVVGVLYSDDFSKGLQNVCFFIVPFTIAFVLLSECRWDARLLRLSLFVVVAEALLFALVGFAEYGTRTLLWNDVVIRSNDFHVYFRVNSLFWDPNVYGRYLSLVLVLLAAVLLWARDLRAAAITIAVGAVVFAALATTFSQSSYAALLGGMAVLAALRWSFRYTVGACAAVVLIGIGGAFATGALDRPNIDTGGRANLVTGGIALFGDRPITGYGSGSFAVAFQAHADESKTPVSESHSEPVTVAAEGGIFGIAAYLAVLVAAFASLTRGLRPLMPGLGGSVGPGEEDPERLTAALARAGILAAFVALLVHTLTYAGFIEDPITWCLLAIGGALAAGTRATD